MKIQELTLHTRDLESMRSCYAGTLELPILSETPGSLTLQAGTTQLTFEQHSEFDGFYHFAFDIPPNRVNEAQAWLEDRVSLLANAEGTRRFLPNRHWNTTNLYFADPAGNILEFIARHNLPNDSNRFGGVLHVSELGVVVPDVPQAIQRLGQSCDLHPFNGQSDTFTALGGHDGMLIVVREGRGWIPVGQPAIPAPCALTFLDENSQQRHFQEN